MSEHYARSQARFEKEVRDKASLATQLTELKSQLRTSTRESTVVKFEFCLEIELRNYALMIRPIYSCDSV